MITNLKCTITFLVILISTTISPQNKYFVIVGSSKEVKISKKIQNEYLKKGYSETIVIKNKAPNTNHRVSVRNFASKKEAINFKKQLQKNNICRDAWVLISNDKIKTPHKPKFNFIQFFKNFADNKGIQFDYIHDYRKGSLQELLYNKLIDIPSYLIIIDIATEKRKESQTYYYYLLSKISDNKTEAEIKIKTQSLGMDVWDELVESKNAHRYINLEDLDEKSIKEYYWKDLKFIGYRYKFTIKL